MEKRRVTIESGELQGCFGWDPRITVFKGIPYAAPPIGDLRWRAPQPVEKWDGVRIADNYGPMSIQDVPGCDPKEFWTKELHPAGPEFEMSEDCLYLNVFTPAKTGNEKLPVLVYIHGGGLMGGYPYEIEFDREHVARKGIVVVAVAYRLGILGFLSHPWLSAEHPDEPKGNYGYLDQLAAIKWTGRNIAAFGGDPEKITIAGQSAGAGSVLAQLSRWHKVHFRQQLFRVELLWISMIRILRVGFAHWKKQKKQVKNFLRRQVFIILKRQERVRH